MSCKFCGSDRQGQFNGEIAISSAEPEEAEKPIAWVFPKLSICLNCGLAEFRMPEEELRSLGGSGGGTTDSTSSSKGSGLP